MLIKFRAVAAGTVMLAASAGVAMAYPATVTTGLNLRSGPSTGYPVETTMPAGATVNVHSCGGGWCHLGFRGFQGYASSAYIARGGGATVVGPAAVTVLPEYYAYAYEYPPYWRNGYFYYWYGGHWRHVRRSHNWWNRHRAFIRSHRHERRVERRHERHQIRRDRRHERHQIRRERRHERHDARQERRHSSQARQVRRHQAQARTQARHASRVHRQARHATHRAHRAAHHARRAAHRANRAARHAQRGGNQRRDRH